MPCAGRPRPCHTGSCGVWPSTTGVRGRGTEFLVRSTAYRPTSAFPGSRLGIWRPTRHFINTCRVVQQQLELRLFFIMDLRSRFFQHKTPDLEVRRFGCGSNLIWLADDLFLQRCHFLPGILELAANRLQLLPLFSVGAIGDQLEAVFGDER